MATIVLTGAAGFIGFHVARRLGAEGHRVIGVDHLGPRFHPSLKHARVAALAGTPGFEFVRLDLADPGAFDALVAACRPDAILHLAAQTGVRYSAEDPHLYVRNNVDAFVAVLQAARLHGVGRLLYASSSSVYGEGDGPRAEDDRADRPVSLYAATKRSNELMAHTYAHQFGLTTVGMRFFTVYGPWGRPDMAVWTFAERMAAGEPIPLYNDGVMRRDFTFIEDVVEGIVRLLWAPLDGARVFNVGSGRCEPLGRLIEVLEAALGCRAERQPMPMQTGDVPLTWSNCDRLFQVTGLRTGIPLDVGVPAFADWFAAHPDVVAAVRAEREAS